MMRAHTKSMSDAIFAFSIDTSANIPVFSKDGKTSVNRCVFRLFSKLINNILDSIPSCSEIAIICPNISLKNIEHIAEILSSGQSRIAKEERNSYFDVVDDANDLGIDMKEISIKKNSVTKSAKEIDEENENENSKSLAKLKEDVERLESSVYIAGEKAVDQTEGEKPDKMNISDDATEIEERSSNFDVIDDANDLGIEMKEISIKKNSVSKCAKENEEKENKNINDFAKLK